MPSLDGQGSKRRRAEIVFNDPGTNAERPPSKRDKVELVVMEPGAPTRALHIEGLRRPLREQDLKGILEERGKLDGFWIDAYKSHCYALYETTEQAKATLKAVDGLDWPPRCKSVMQPSYVSVEEAQGMISSGGRAVLKRVGSQQGAAEQLQAKAGGRRGGGNWGAGGDTGRGTMRAEAAQAPLTAQGPRGRSTDADDAMGGVGDGAVAGADSPSGRGEGSPSDGEAAPAPRVIDLTEKPPPSRAIESVSDLFKLTTATPCLFWTPLTDEEVKARMAVEAQLKKPSQGKSANGTARSPGGDRDGSAEA